MGGAEISLIVAIDFTGSNGDPKTPSSLHYRNPNSGPNEYMQAIYSVGSIIEPYDSDRIFPVTFHFFLIFFFQFFFFSEQKKNLTQTRFLDLEQNYQMVKFLITSMLP